MVKMESCWHPFKDKVRTEHNNPEVGGKQEAGLGSEGFKRSKAQTSKSSLLESPGTAGSSFAWGCLKEAS